MIIQNNILDNFQREKLRCNCSVYQFILESHQVLSSEQQLDLIRLDLRLRFVAGEEPAIGEYERDFPHFGSLIPTLIESTAKLIIDESVPLEERFGSLPLEIGDYRIVQRVNRDHCSVHYDAIQISLDRRVRIRALLFPTKPAIAKARALALIEHPNLDNTLDVLLLSGVVMIVSHLVVGNSLQRVLQTAPESVTAGRMVDWTSKVASGLLEAHRFDLSHEGICPENILIREDGEAVLVNFSLAGRSQPQAMRTHELLTEVLPFPYRSAAEQSLTSESTIADTRALGLVFFQMLVKKSLDGFYGQMSLPNENERLNRVIKDGLKSVSEELSQLKAICESVALSATAAPSPWSLKDFETELAIWKRCEFLSSEKVKKPAALSVNQCVKSSGTCFENRANPGTSKKHRFLPEIRKLLSSFLI